MSFQVLNCQFQSLADASDIAAVLLYRCPSSASTSFFSCFVCAFTCAATGPIAFLVVDLIVVMVHPQRSATAVPPHDAILTQRSGEAVLSSPHHLQRSPRHACRTFPRSCQCAPSVQSFLRAPFFLSSRFFFLLPCHAWFFLSLLLPPYCNIRVPFRYLVISVLPAGILARAETRFHVDRFRLCHHWSSASFSWNSAGSATTQNGRVPRHTRSGLLCALQVRMGFFVFLPAHSHWVLLCSSLLRDLSSQKTEESDQIACFWKPGE